MTGIADFYLYMKRPHSKDRRQRLMAHFFWRPTNEKQRFVVLSWKRTGSNLLCGVLHHHPEIIMHNELFNAIDVFTYHPAVFQQHQPRWTVLTRNLFPEDFLDFVWTGSYASGSNDSDSTDSIKPRAKAVGFKSFPEHWSDVRNDACFLTAIMQDFRIKKIVLRREDELAVYVSMLRADQTGLYMTHAYPQELRLHIDPAKFQAFLDHYRYTFQKKVPFARGGTRHLSFDVRTNGRRRKRPRTRQ